MLQPSFGVFERPIWFQRLAHNELVCMCFTGRSALHLWNQLSSRMGFEPHPNSTMCVRAGTYGRLTPLVTDLPRNNATMVIFVLPPESLGEICTCARLAVAFLFYGYWLMFYRLHAHGIHLVLNLSCALQCSRSVVLLLHVSWKFLCWFLSNEMLSIKSNPLVLRENSYR